jgi:hypothetical protein
LGLSIAEVEHYSSTERKIFPYMRQQLVKSDGVDHGASMAASADLAQGEAGTSGVQQGAGGSAEREI